jgi:hypothetical protein
MPHFDDRNSIASLATIAASRQHPSYGRPRNRS